MAGILSYVLRRQFSTSRRLMAHGGTPEELEAGMKLWKNLALFVGIPAVALCMINTYLTTKEEDHTPPEFHAYEHMRVRTKRFPWGDGNHSLFHNPHANALPSGYEVDIHSTIAVCFL
ncbi:cytochrome c oxidase subunit 6A, mitochondrial-like isoform X1 [Homalodisca vitripennis]|uniref:cytochrome c oxidase subunit 6A, mitochondrial-like isoform X1 n=1 Tax=Homalodisca vitripennis TaxID=197043 RepID=UPI001EEB62F1|nr:cytochrome c oxidase subunit 6A, mitochondrial-like isoform X1 [Homalodisca vitripennis]